MRRLLTKMSPIGLDVKTTVVVARQGDVTLRIEKKLEVRQLWESYFEDGPITLELEECEPGENWQPSHELPDYVSRLETLLAADPSVHIRDAIRVCGCSNLQLMHALNELRKKLLNEGAYSLKNKAGVLTLRRKGKE